MVQRLFHRIPKLRHSGKCRIEEPPGVNIYAYLNTKIHEVGEGVCGGGVFTFKEVMDKPRMDKHWLSLG